MATSMDKKELPPLYDNTGDSSIILKYENGCLYIISKQETKIVTFIDYIVKHYLSWHSQHTAKIMLQLSRLLQNKSMSINITCKYDIPKKPKLTHVQLLYDSATKQMTLTADDGCPISFTYNEHKHKQAIEDMFNDFYFVVGHRLASANEFKQLTADIIKSNPEITARQFMTLL